MNDEEMVRLLAACKPLAEKLHHQGPDIALNTVETNAIIGFQKVYSAGQASRLLNEAGLSSEDYLLLGRLAGRQEF